MTAAVRKVTNRRLLEHLMALEARVDEVLELGFKDKVLRSGLKVTIRTPHVAGTPGPVQHYPKDVVIRDRASKTMVNYQKHSGREADIGMLDTDPAHYRSKESSGALRKIAKAVLPNLRKNNTAVSFLPLAQSSAAKAVKTEKLMRSYPRILKRAGFKEAPGLLPRYVPGGR